MSSSHAFPMAHSLSQKTKDEGFVIAKKLQAKRDEAELSETILVDVGSLARSYSLPVLRAQKEEELSRLLKSQSSKERRNAATSIAVLEALASGDFEAADLESWGSVAIDGRGRIFRMQGNERVLEAVALNVVTPDFDDTIEREFARRDFSRRWRELGEQVHMKPRRPGNDAA